MQRMNPITFETKYSTMARQITWPLALESHETGISAGGSEQEGHHGYEHKPAISAPFQATRMRQDRGARRPQS